MKYKVCKEIDEDKIDKLYHQVINIDELCWIRRDNLEAGRGVDNEQCGYDFLSYPAMPDELKQYVREIAPRPDGYIITDIVINRYNPGDYIGKHLDRASYRMNKVIALQQKGDGIRIDDDDLFVEDVKGQSVTLFGAGPVHSVPAAKSLRHVLIYLYE